MNQLNCEQIQFYIQQQFDVELAFEDEQAVLTHLESCALCSRFRSQIELVIVFSQDLPPSEDYLPANYETLVQRVAEAVPKPTLSPLDRVRNFFNNIFAMKSKGTSIIRPIDSRNKILFPHRYSSGGPTTAGERTDEVGSHHALPGSDDDAQLAQSGHGLGHKFGMALPEPEPQRGGPRTLAESIRDRLSSEKVEQQRTVSPESLPVSPELPQPELDLGTTEEVSAPTNFSTGPAEAQPAPAADWLSDMDMHPMSSGQTTAPESTETFAPQDSFSSSWVPDSQETGFARGVEQDMSSRVFNTASQMISPHPESPEQQPDLRQTTPEDSILNRLTYVLEGEQHRESDETPIPLATPAGAGPEPSTYDTPASTSTEYQQYIHPSVAPPEPPAYLHPAPAPRAAPPSSSAYIQPGVAPPAVPPTAYVQPGVTAPAAPSTTYVHPAAAAPAPPSAYFEPTTVARQPAAPAQAPPAVVSPAAPSPNLQPAAAAPAAPTQNAGTPPPPAKSITPSGVASTSPSSGSRLFQSIDDAAIDTLFSEHLGIGPEVKESKPIIEKQPQVQPPPAPEEVPAAPAEPTIETRKPVPASKGLLSIDDEAMDKIFAENLGIEEKNRAIARGKETSVPAPQATSGIEVEGLGRLDTAADAATQQGGPGQIGSIGKFLLDQQDLQTIGTLAGSDLADTNMRVLTAGASEDLNTLLNSISSEPGVQGSVIVGHDGILVTSNFADELEAESIAVWCLGIYLNTDNAIKKMGHNNIQQIVAQTSKGYVIIVDFGAGILATISNDPQVRELIPLMRRVTRAISA